MPSISQISPFALLVSLTGGLCAAPVSDDLDDLFNLSLKDLSNIVVKIASNTDQTIIEAPLVVSRYKRSDLEKMGVSSLREMLEFVPGLIIQNIQSGSGTIMSRGLVESFNQKILFLLDEVPYWAPSHSSIPLDGIPFEAISHIEVVRGPAPVHYGTNASAAVINVVTLDQQAGRIDVSTNEQQFKSGARLQMKGNQWWVSLAVEKQNDSGHDAYIEHLAPSFGLADSGDFNQGIDKQSVLIRSGYKNLTFIAHIFESTYNDNSGPKPFIITEGLNYKGQLVHVDYQQPFFNSSVKVFAGYNQFSLLFPIQHVLTPQGSSDPGGFRFEDENNNFRWRVGVASNTKVNDQLSLLIGYDYEHRSTSEYQIFNGVSNATVAPIMEADTNTEQGLHAQIDYRYQPLRLTLGGRYVNNISSGESISPEASVVYQFNQQESVKILFSEGFNSPNFIQKGINFGAALQGNPDLKVEKISTLDMAYTFGNDKRLFVANLFYIEAKDLIQRDVSTGIIQFDNTGDSTRSGIETDYQVFDDEWTWLSSLSYLQQGNDENEDASSLVAPEILLKLGAFYNINHHTLGGSINYASDRAAADAYTAVNVSYHYQWNKFSLYSTIYNLIGNDITSADTQNFASNMQVVDTSGTRFNVGFRYSF